MTQASMSEFVLLTMEPNQHTLRPDYHPLLHVQKSLLALSNLAARNSVLGTLLLCCWHEVGASLVGRVGLLQASQDKDVRCTSHN